MGLRADPLLASTYLMQGANAIAIDQGGCATTGILSLKPGSINTIPNEVEYTLDIRHPSDSALAAMERDIRAVAESIVNAQEKYPLSIEFDLMFDYPATHFHPDCREAIRTAAEASVGAQGARDIVSGAGHDSCATSKHCPTSMVFIPCEEGLSHNPKEYATPEDCVLGAQVLMDAALIFDSKRA
jgi:acetylornithine deacetylase/succinyl-diaminopimelate desuccinylase-like protein